MKVLNLQWRYLVAVHTNINSLMWLLSCGVVDADYYPAIAACSNEEFMCDNGKCIPRQWHCNGADECGDGSDERHCSFSKCLTCMLWCYTSWNCKMSGTCDTCCTRWTLTMTLVMMIAPLLWLFIICIIIIWSDLPPHQQSSREAELHWSIESTCSMSGKESCSLE